MRRRTSLIALIAAVVLGALLLPSVASAHELSIGEALRRLSPYIQQVFADPPQPYVKAAKSCRRDTEHLVGCTVGWDTAASQAAEQKRQSEWVCPVPPRTPCAPRRPKRIAPYACFEHLQAYYKAHPAVGGRSLTVYLKHTRGQCGKSRLLGG